MNIFDYDLERDFRDLPDYPGYMACRDGFIVSFKRRIPQVLKTGYVRGVVTVPLCKDGGLHVRQLAREILTAFVPFPADPWLCFVKYKDGDQRNCRLDNLEWFVAETGDDYNPALSHRKGVLRPDFTKDRMAEAKKHQSRESVERGAATRKKLYAEGKWRPGRKKRA